MIFSETGLEGVVVIELDPHHDARGSFARSFSAATFEAQGLLTRPVEANIARNHEASTLRGLHYQREPHPDPKVVRCTSGSIFDVAVDLRAESRTYLQWVGVELTARNAKALHVPAGCAHGFLTLEDDTEVSYLMGETYRPELAAGVRWNDPAFGIAWPKEPAVMSERDSNFPDFTVDRSRLATS